MKRHAKAAFAVAVLCSFFVLGAAPALAVYVHSATFSGEGSGNGQLAKFPGRAAVERATGNLFVVDQGNDRVQVFAPNGSGADYLTQFGAGQLSKPWGIALDRDGGQTYVYVADAGNNRIVKYVSNGASTPSFTVDAGFTSPSPAEVGDFKVPLAVDPSTHDLLLADPTDDLVQRYDSDGTPGGSFDGSAGAGSPGAFTGLLDLAVNSSGDVYVIDENGDIVEQAGTSAALRYSAAGEYKATLSPVGPSQRPAVVTVDPASDDVAVSGDQDAVWRDGYASFYLFDSVDAPLGAATTDARWGSVSGLAFGSGGIYIVLYPGLYQGAPYRGAPHVQRFDDVAAPVAEIADASDVAELSATLNGTVDPQGAATTCRFEYSTDTSFSQSVPCTTDPGSGTGPVAVSAELTGLPPDTTYNFRLFASSYGGLATSTSASRAFTTLHVDLPATTIAPATAITATGAQVSGTVNPQGFATTARFEYSGDGGATWVQGPLHSSATDADLANATVPVALTDTLSGLEPNSPYRVRLAAANPAGSSVSTITDFATQRSAPSVQTLPASQVSGSSAALKARVNPHGEPTEYYFEYGLTATYGNSIPAKPVSVGSGRQFVPLGQQPYSLLANRTYHYRVVAINATGRSVGADLTFTTPPEVACANQEFRRGPSATLPDCRAFELVSPQDNAGNSFGTSMRVPISSPDGSSTLWGTKGPVPGTGSVNGNGNEFYSDRTPNGWVTKAITPEADPTRPAEVAGVALSTWRSEDLSKVVLAGGSHQVLPGAPIGAYRAMFLYTKATGGLEWITKPTIDNPTGEPTFSVDGGSADLGRIVLTARPTEFGVAARLIPEDAGRVDSFAFGAGAGVYEYIGGELRAVGILPGGGVPPKGASIPNSNPPAGAEYLSNAVSKDGRRIYFEASPTVDDEEFLYLREDHPTKGLRSVLISESQLTGEGAPAEFGFASPDGSKVWFTTFSQRLTADAPSFGIALYEYDVDAEELTYLPEVGVPYESSHDGSRFVYVNQETFELWVSDEGELSRIGAYDFYSAFFRNARLVRMTPDGSRFLFYTSAEVGAGEFNNAGGFQQAYLYDLDDKKLVCVSCPPPGVAPSGDAHISGAITGYSGLKPRSERSLTVDGKRVFFDTPDPLDDRDVNGVRDVYEWTDHGVFLISGGTGDQPSWIGDVSPSGDDVFFMTANRLSEWDRDGDVDIYDARVGGGFAPPALTDPCDLDCQGAPAIPPPLDQPGTSALQGAGNPRDCSHFGPRVAKAQRQVRKAKSKPKRAKAKQRLRQVKRQAASCRAAGTSKGGVR